MTMPPSRSDKAPSKRGPRGKRPLPSAPAKDSPGIKNPYVRFRPLDKPRIAQHETTLWDYPSQHYGKTTQGDPNYRGATPSHVVWNLVTRFTKKNDLVVDPFVGSGTTLDVCRDLERRGRGFDLATTRSDVTIADARSALVEHIERETAHLIFMDPPYADNLSYSDDARCIGKRAFEDGSWSEAMTSVIEGAWRALKPEGHLALFVSDIMHVQDVTVSEAGRKQQRTEKRFANLGVELARICLEKGWTFVDHVAVVRHGKALDDPRLRGRAESQGFLLRGFSHLLIFQKPAAGPKGAPKWKTTPVAAAAAAPWTPKGSSTGRSKAPPKSRREAPVKAPPGMELPAPRAKKGGSKPPPRGGRRR